MVSKISAKIPLLGRKAKLSGTLKKESTPSKVHHNLQRAEEQYVAKHNQAAEAIKTRDQLQAKGTQQLVEIAGESDVQRVALHQVGKHLKPCRTMAHTAAKATQEYQGQFESSTHFLKGVGQSIIGAPKSLVQGGRKLFKGEKVTNVPAASGFVDGAQQLTGSVASSASYANAIAKVTPLAPTGVHFYGAQRKVVNRTHELAGAKTGLVEARTAKEAAAHGRVVLDKKGRIVSASAQYDSPEAFEAALKKTHNVPDNVSARAAIHIPSPKNFLPESAPKPISQEKLCSDPPTTQAQILSHDKMKAERTHALKVELSNMDMNTLGELQYHRDQAQWQAVQSGAQAVLSEKAATGVVVTHHAGQMLGKKLRQPIPSLTGLQAELLSQAHYKVGQSLGQHNVIGKVQNSVDAQVKFEAAAKKPRSDVKEFVTLRAEQHQHKAEGRLVDESGDIFYDAVEQQDTARQAAKKEKQYRQQAIAELPQEGQHVLLNDAVFQPMPSGMEWIARPLRAWGIGF